MLLLELRYMSRKLTILSNRLLHACLQSDPPPEIRLIRLLTSRARADRCLDAAQPKNGGPADFSQCTNNCSSWQRLRSRRLNKRLGSIRM